MKHIIKDIRNEKLYCERIFNTASEAQRFLKGLFGFYECNGVKNISGEGDAHTTTYYFTDGIKVVYSKEE